MLIFILQREKKKRQNWKFNNLKQPATGMKLLQDYISIILNPHFYDEQRRTKSIVIFNEFLAHL